MEPSETGKLYDRIATWWHQQHEHSQYGVSALERAMRYAPAGGQALDVGCGSGGRMISRLQKAGFEVTGLDVSAEMIHLARKHHPEVHFAQVDVRKWETSATFDLILAWDSMFHLPLSDHEMVVSKMCQWLKPGGILLYTFGDAAGEHYSEWHHEQYYYSSVGIRQNLEILHQNGCECRHLELDQYPHPHVYVIARKLTPP